MQKAKKRFWDERFLLAKPLIDRAIQREELAEKTQVREFFELAASPLFYRTIITGESISDQDIELLLKEQLHILGPNKSRYLHQSHQNYSTVRHIDIFN